MDGLGRMSKMEKLLRVSEAAKILGVGNSTIRLWIRQGRIRAVRIGKLWRIPQSEVERLTRGRPKGDRAVIYARVSSRKQKKEGNLERQIERLKKYCTAKGYRIVATISDVASGLKEDRIGLKKLMDMAENGEIDIVVVEFRDRLTRFGFEYLERYFASNGVRVEVVEETEKSYVEEMIEDFAAIIISFAARIYGLRSQKFKRIKKFVEQEIRR